MSTTQSPYRPIAIGLAASLGTGVLFSIFIASFNLGYSGLIPGLLRLFPLFLGVGLIVGIFAGRLQVGGCTISISAGIASIIGMFTIAVLTEQPLSMLVGYIVGTSVGGGVGVLIFLSAIGLGSLWQRIMRS